MWSGEIAKYRLNIDLVKQSRASPPQNEKEDNEIQKQVNFKEDRRDAVEETGIVHSENGVVEESITASEAIIRWLLAVFFLL